MVVVFSVREKLVSLGGVTGVCTPFGVCVGLAIAGVESVI